MNKKIIVTIIFIIIFLEVTTRVNKMFGLILIIAALLYLLFKSLPLIFMFVGNKKYISENIDRAMPWYEKSYKLGQNNPMIVINYAYIILKQGDINKSEVLLREVLKKDLSSRDKTNAVINLSLILWKKHCLDDAINLLEELYKNDYKATLLYQNLGFYYILKGDLEKALEFNLEAYNYNDSDASILDNVAMNYYLMNDYDKAIEIYDKLIPMNPAFVTTYYYYGLTLKKKDKKEEALEMFQKALTCRFSFLSSVSKEEVEKEININTKNGEKE